MKKNTKVFLGSSALLLSILILLITATPASSGSEISILEAKVNGAQYEGRYVTTEGFLQAGSVDWRADEIELRFTIEDEEGNTLDVFHHGVRPDNFSDEVIVIVHGYLQEDGVFEAERVQTRCPSVYEAEDPENYDADFHRELLREGNNED
ncbi:cytochrome c-type biogenesis protein CcmE [Evansella vedderi]|uniref:Cytochrome c-type biogenesis protein CcmE n=1 Tax=Evansella vedderi TaxID=38282 RepID=A0ABU0A2T2_9BACI|nr:cytochrome c maturation protein CcmE [Evansella vedderi]MDQ0257797.1 cytochrome c-type biogenesis protein CcmE [Evansella vedderi]